MQEERMLKWFEYAHLPEHLQVVSRPLGDLAGDIACNIAPGLERTVALRKLMAIEVRDMIITANLDAVPF